LGVELNALNTMPESERRGHPRDLFWPWFAANVSVFGISYGAFLLGFGISFAQAVTDRLIGIVVSFLLCGIVSWPASAARRRPWCSAGRRSG
jgi:purine-cytosine permease-like protein